MKKFLFAVLFFSLARGVWAVAPEPYTLSATCSFRIGGVGNGIMTIYDASGLVPALAKTVTGGVAESDCATAWFVPNKEYYVNFQASGPAEYWLSFVAPEGYQFYVDGVPTSIKYRNPGGGAYSDGYMVGLRPVIRGGRRDAAVFSGFNIGQGIGWEIGLGGNRSGHSMGLVAFREFDLATSPSSRDRLIFTPMINNFQCDVVRDGPSTQTVRQIAVPQTTVDFLDDGTGGYWIKFYAPSQGTKGATYYTFTGSPWRTIHVESPASNQLKMTETEGSVSRVSQLSLASGVVSSGTYQWLLQEGDTSSWLRTTTHTSTYNFDQTRDDIVLVRTGGTSGTIVSKTKYHYSCPGTYATGTADTMIYNTTTIPLSATPGSTITFSTNITNTGTNTYGSNHYLVLRDSALNNLSFASLNGLAPTARTNASLTLTVPSTQGFYTYYLQGLNNGVVWFSSNAIITLNVFNSGSTGLSNSATYNTTTFPLSAMPGAALPFTSNLTNTGTNAWGSNHSLNLLDGSFTSLASASMSGVATGASTNVTINANAAPYSGTYTYYLHGRETGVGYFSIRAQMSLNVLGRGWGEELEQVIDDPDAAALTKTFTYYTDATAAGNYRRIKSVTDATGNWTAFTYYDDWYRRGQVQYEYHPYVSSPSTAASASTTTGRVVSYDYVADWTGRFTRPSLREEKVNNVATGKMVWTYDNTSSLYGPRDKMDIDSYRDASNYHRDRMETARSDSVEEAGEPCLTNNANQARTTWNRSTGVYSGGVFTTGLGTNWRELVVHGTTNSSGATSISSYDGQGLDPTYVLPAQSTMDIAIRDAAGNVIQRETWVYSASSTWARLTYETLAYDSAGRLTSRVSNAGTQVSNTYTSGLLVSTVDFAGIETQYTYDAIGRIATSIKKGASTGGYTAQGDITTTYTYDGAGRITQTQVAGGALSQTGTNQYDLAGRQTQTVAPGSYTTGIGYTSGGKIVTAMLPGGATKITECYLDGQPKSVSGTAVVAEDYTPSIDTGTGNKLCQSVFGGNTAAWTNSYSDWLGRTIAVWRPEWNGSNYAKQWYYNSYGLLYKFTQPGVADTLYLYDTLGVKTMEGLDINANGTLDGASDDRITQKSYGVQTWNGGTDWWMMTSNYTYATSGSGTPTGQGYTLMHLNNTTNYLSQSYSVDIYGNATYEQTTVDRTNKLIYSDVTRPDSTTMARKITYNGLAVSSRGTTNLTTTFGYDALGRPTQSTDPRTGTTTTAYISGTSQVSTITDPASVVQATYTYDSAGRVATLTNALSKVSRYGYTNRNEVLHTWGDTELPVEYGYDASGHQVTMKTYRGGTGWAGSTWPTATAGTADTTTWAFNAATNLLASKTDASGKAVSYTYTVPRQISTRLWARILTGTTHVTTTYTYSSTTGELSTVTYNDGTQGLSYSYNRLGQSSQIGDITGNRTFTYNLGSTLELTNEIVGTSSGDFFGDHRITRGYDTTGAGTKGRYTALQVGTAANPVNDAVQSYGYDALGRLNAAGSFGYSYVSNSNLISTTTYGAYTDTRVYDSTHDWVDSRTTVVSTVSPATKSAFTYTQDNMGRITQDVKTGEVFSRYGNGTQGLTTYYGYDDRSQLTSEVTKVGATSTVLTGRDDAHAYDSIGNRSTVTHNGNTATYTANSLNQYSQRTVPGIFDVAGAAATSATVTVNGSGTGVTRHGEYFFKGQSLGNSPNAIFSSLSISDGTTTTPLAAFLAGTPEAMTYDDDGNMLTDGRWDYTYDAENRLISLRTHASLSPGTIANADARKLDFKYDYLGRRVQKTVRAGYNGTSFTTIVTDTKFLYDGWDVLFEYNSSAGLAWVRYYTWGLDVSGTLQGAGGVGGLLTCWDVAGVVVFIPCYDAMGNVHGAIDQSTGGLVAAYEYDGFGNTIRQSGTSALANPFRFSTKYTDNETSLVYYGLRYYSPSQGRFIGKDPSEEKGGLNLYAFCRNNARNSYDYLGMDAFIVPNGYYDGPGGGYMLWGTGEGDSMDYMAMGIASGNSAANGMGMAQDMAAALSAMITTENANNVQAILSSISAGAAAAMEGLAAANQATIANQADAVATALGNALSASASAQLGASVAQTYSVGLNTIAAGQINLVASSLGTGAATSGAVPEGNVTIGPMTVLSYSDANSTAEGTDRLDQAGRIGGGTGAVVGAIENLQNGATGVWLGKNGKLYPTSWGGNGSTGGRIAYAGKIADAAHTAGNVIGVIGVGISVVQLGQGVAAGNTNQIVQSTADVGMGVAGFFGPIGWAASTGYFVGQTIDHLTGATDKFAKWYTGYP